MNTYSTGVATCDQINEMHFQGNIIPHAWFKTIVKSNLKHPKPNLLAISILSDIVYWYRPTEVRDETTGQLLGFRKKFRSDLLQRSYEDMSAMFGCSKDAIKDAVVFLEELGVVRREFRTITIGSTRCNNVMFLALDAGRLKEHTFPADPSGEINPEGAGKFTRRCEEVFPEPAGEFPRTNTKNTKQKISTKITPSIPPASEATNGTVAPISESDGLSEEELLDEVETELFSERAIPYSYHQDERRMLCAIRSLSDWYEMPREHFYSDLEFESYQMLVDCLAEMACDTSARTYNGSFVAGGTKVIDRLNQCVKPDGSLYHFVEETVDDYVKAAANAPIKNARGYMKSVIWSSLLSYKVKFEANFACTNA